MTKRRPRPGDDLSYYLGPSAKSATAEQCAELERALEEASRAVGETTSFPEKGSGGWETGPVRGG